MTFLYYFGNLLPTKTIKSDLLLLMKIVCQISKKGGQLMTFDFSGLDKVFDELNQKAEQLSGSYDFDEIFPKSYMQSVSKYDSIEDFLKASPETITNAEEFEKADEAVLDVFVSENTNFSTWQEMLNDATTQLVVEKLKF